MVERLVVEPYDPKVCDIQGCTRPTAAWGTFGRTVFPVCRVHREKANG